jgi:hypothetical protein
MFMEQIQLVAIGASRLASLRTSARLRARSLTIDREGRSLHCRFPVAASDNVMSFAVTLRLGF